MTDFQPTLPIEQPFSDAELAFMDESPPGLFPDNQDSNFGYLIRKIFSDRIQELINQQNTIYNEKFVLTSTQFLDEWERNVGLPVNPTGSTIAQRRNAILNRRRKGAFSRPSRNATIENFLTATFGDAPAFDPSGIALSSGGLPLFSGTSSLVGLYRVYEDIRNFAYTVFIKNTVTPDISGLTRELTRMTPAGISFTIDNTPADVLRYAKLVMNSSPGAYWRLGTNNDSSGNGKTLTPHGVVAGSVASPGLLTAAVAESDGAADFAGSVEYFNAVCDASLVAPNEITLEAWVNMDTFQPVGFHRIFVSQDTRYISCATVAGPVHQWTFTLKLGGVQTYLTLAPTIPIATGTRYHVVGTYDGKTMKLYINGLLAAQLVPPTKGITSDNSQFNVGAYSGGDLMDGKLDEIAVYNRALSPAVILDHYNTGLDIATY